MRFLMSAVLLLFLAAGSSSALAGEVLIEVRPGLTVQAGDGQLGRAARDRLERAEDAGARQELLAYLVEKHPSPDPIFDLAAKVELRAENTGGVILQIGRKPLRSLSFNLFVMSRRPPDPGDFEWRIHPAEVRLRIDGRPAGPEPWGQFKWVENSVSGVVLLAGWSLPREAQARFQDEILAAILKGRKMILETVLKNGENVTASFDLSGLDEALNLMEQKMAASDQTAGGEIERLKKELAALKQRSR